MQQLLARFKALGDPTRLKLLRLLMERECAVHELVEILSTGQSRVSQHLAKLKAAGLVNERREGRETYYRAHPGAVLGLDQALLFFLYAPMDQLHGMRLEWQRWRHLAAEQAGVQREPADGLPVFFRPAPAEPGARPAHAIGKRKPNILFLCTANSFRSQIAEAWTRALGGVKVEVQSAGLEPTRVHPAAEAVMREVGIDMAGQYSKGVTPEMLTQADVVVTLCGAALGWFPVSNRDVRRQHWPFPDPAALADTDEAVWQESRKVRDGIGRRVEGLLASLTPAC